MSITESIRLSMTRAAEDVADIEKRVHLACLRLSNQDTISTTDASYLASLLADLTGARRDLATLRAAAIDAGVTP